MKTALQEKWMGLTGTALDLFQTIFIGWEKLCLSIAIKYKVTGDKEIFK